MFQLIQSPSFVSEKDWLAVVQLMARNTNIEARNSYYRGKLSTIHLLAPTSLAKLIL
jgi:hypothetical protein